MLNAIVRENDFETLSHEEMTADRTVRTAAISPACQPRGKVYSLQSGSGASAPLTAKQMIPAAVSPSAMRGDSRGGARRRLTPLIHTRAKKLCRTTERPHSNKAREEKAAQSRRRACEHTPSRGSTVTAKCGSKRLIGGQGVCYNIDVKIL